MREYFAIRSEEDRDHLLSYLASKRLGFRACVEPMEKLRSGSARKYYGVILNYLASYTGHSQREIHEYYKQVFNIETTTTLSQSAFGAYLEAICAEWAAEGVYLPQPDEVILTDELTLS